MAVSMAEALSGDDFAQRLRHPEPRLLHGKIFVGEDHRVGGGGAQGLGEPFEGRRPLGSRPAPVQGLAQRLVVDV